jgi:hypothetical protein
MDGKSNHEVIDELLGDFQNQRDALKEMIKDVEDLKADINKLFPTKLDARYQRFFEEKIKTAVSLLNVLLDVRKELIKTMKDEIDIRRKVKVAGEDDLDSLFNVRDLAKKVEHLHRKKIKVEDKITKKKKTTKKKTPISIIDKRELNIPKSEDETISESLEENLNAKGV